MLETPHVIIAAAIATKVENPILALSLALGSHFIMERVPHWNPHLNTEKNKYGKVTSSSYKFVLFDSILALFIGTTISLYSLPDINKAMVVLAASFLGVLPDLIEAPYYFLNTKNHFIESIWIPFKKSIQVDASKYWGLFNQVLVSLIALYWIFFS